MSNKKEPVSKLNQSTISDGPKGTITRIKKPITISSHKKEELQVTWDGYIRIKRIIKRTVGRGSDPDKIVWHKHKWTTITKKVSSHPRGKARSIANLIFAMIREDYDNFNLPEPLLPPVIIEPEPGPEPVQEIPEDSGYTIEVQEGIPSGFEDGVHRSIDHGISSVDIEKSSEPKIKIEPKVNDLNNLLTRVRKVRRELDGGCE